MSLRTRPGRLGSNFGWNDISPAKQTAQEYSPNIKFYQFLINEYGNLNFIIDVADSLIDFAKRFKKKSPRYQGALNFLKYGVPAAVVTSQLIAKLNQYRRIKEGRNTVYDERESKVKQLMENKIANIVQDDFHLGKDVFYWLFQKPKTELFHIMGFYNYENLEPISDVWTADAKTILVSLKYEEIRFVWSLNMCPSMNDEVYVRESIIYYDAPNQPFKSRLKAAIFKEFLNHFDVKSNVICLHPSGLHAFPRQEVNEHIRQFSLEQFSNEIRKVLKRKKKRGFAFVGIPGTGKSTIIRKLETMITDYPIIYTTALNYASVYEIQETFTTIQFLQPCIVVMEDLDSYDLRDKKNNLGVFLEEIDDISGKLNAVFIATINDTSLVHYTLINRPGRFDQVILIKPPQDTLEVYDVMNVRYSRNQKSDETITTDFMLFEDIDESILKKIVDHQYTQADICEVIEKALLLDDSINNESLMNSLKELEDSKEAIKKCNFKGEDPRSIGSDTVDPAYPSGHVLGSVPSSTDIRRYANRG